MTEPVNTDAKAARRKTQKLAMRDLRQRRADAREKAEREREAVFKPPEPKEPT